MNAADYYEDGFDDVHPVFQEVYEEHTLDYLKEFKFRFLFTNLEKKSDKKVQMAKTIIANKELKFFTGIDVILVFDKRIWFEFPKYQRPLLYQSLLKIDINDNGSLVKCKPDIQEFSQVVRCYGAWKTDLEYFEAQLDLYKNPNQMKLEFSINQ